MKQYEVVTEPIQTEQYRDFVVTPHQGAVVVFTGHVREWTNGVFRVRSLRSDGREETRASGC